MRKKYSLIIAIIAIGLCSYETNSTSQTGDATGSPLSNTECADCHSSGAIHPRTTILATIYGTNTYVTSFEPGKQYTISLSSIQPNAALFEFGYQACVLDADNKSAGTITAATAGSSLVLKDGVYYLEHASPITTSGTTARIYFNWTAPNSSKPVTIYANFVHSNGYDNINGDRPGEPGQLTLMGINVGVGSQTLSEKVTVFPIPATDQLNVQFSDMHASNVVLEIWDLSGKKVWQLSRPLKSGDRISVPLGEFVKGTYFMNVQAGDQKCMKAFIVQ